MSDTSNPKERRLVLRLLHYWRDLCGDRDLPESGAVDGAAIGDMWPYCFIIGLSGDEPAFTYFGDWHGSFYGADMTGRPLADLTRGTLAERATNYYETVVERGVPITYGGELEEPVGRNLLYRSILMPMSDDGGDTVDALLGGANCRVIPDEPAG